ncbi:hypothetical protein JYU20_02280 [Bacteroidales bacterium AH-315-I05]|nr:hypothetical protein [Bacteroidales bacterium AH-315-I05]
MNSYRTAFIVYFIAIFLPFAQAQNQALIDSLESALSQSYDDTNSVKLLNQLSWKYMQHETEKAYHLADSALKISENNDFKSGISTALNFRAIANNKLGRYDEALEDYH